MKDDFDILESIENEIDGKEFEMSESEILSIVAKISGQEYGAVCKKYDEMKGTTS